MVANFKSYESQARLVVAMVAAHPGVKWDYKAIAAHFGNEATYSSIEHQFRPARNLAPALRDAVAGGMNAADWAYMATMKEDKIKTEIARLFGESTAAGIEFQFRGIKKDAKALKSAADAGQSTVATFASTHSTPRKPRGPSTSTPKSTSATPKAGGKRKSTGAEFFSNVLAANDTPREVDYEYPPVTGAGSPATTAPKANKRQKTSAGAGTFVDDDMAGFFDDGFGTASLSPPGNSAAPLSSKGRTPSLTTSLTSDGTNLDGAARTNSVSQPSVSASPNLTTPATSAFNPSMYATTPSKHPEQFTSPYGQAMYTTFPAPAVEDTPVPMKQRDVRVKPEPDTAGEKINELLYASGQFEVGDGEYPTEFDDEV